MTVYKAFLIGLKRDKWVILLYTAIFLIMSFTSLSMMNRQAQESFEISRPRILFLDEEEGQFAAALSNHLAQVASVRPAETDYESASVIVASDDADLLIRVPRDAQARIGGGETVVHCYFEPGSVPGYLAFLEIDKFIRYLDAYQKTHGEIDYSAIARVSAETADVKMLPRPGEFLNSTEWFRFYMSFFHYVYLACVLHVVVPLMTQMNEGGLRTRRSVSPIRPSSFLAQLFLGILTFVVGLLVFFALIGLALIGFRIDLRVLGVIALDMAVFTVALVGFVSLLGSLQLRREVTSAVANILSLIVSFTSGIFIDPEVLPSSVVAFSKFFPVYHSARIVRDATMLWPQIGYHLGIQLLFALVFCLAGIFFSVNRRRAAVRTM